MAMGRLFPVMLVGLGVGLFLGAGCKDKPDDDDDGTSDGGTGDGGASDGGSADGGGDVQDADSDGYPADQDCDDNDADIHPGADELCDGVDNDCDTETDEDDAVDATDWYPDGDGDGYGIDTVPIRSCAQPEHYAARGGDCADDDDQVNPGEAEVCDGVDNDCSGLADDDPVDGSYRAEDLDADGLGAPGTVALRCGGVDNEWDCDDLEPSEPQVVDGSAAAGSADGTLGAPWTTVQDGIAHAAECVIVFAGTYHEAIDFLGKDLVVAGIDGATATIIDASGTGAPAATFKSAESAAAVLQGFTLANGEGFLEESSESTACGSSETCTDYYSTYSGGGLYLDLSSPTLRDLLIVDNTLPPTSVTVVGNDTWYVYSFGGGACFQRSGATLERVNFLGNYADQGGALYVDETSTVDLSASLVSANSATDGAGMLVEGGTLALLNVLSTWNAGSAMGGGLMLIGGTAEASNVTYGGDDAPTGGGVLITADGLARLDSSIVAGAATGAGVTVTTGTFVGTYNDVTANAGGQYSGTADPTGTSGNISADPRFQDVTDDGDPSNDDWHLRSDSPAVDAGNPAASANDSDGTRNDMGASGGPGGGWF